MTLLTVVKDVCATVGVMVPDTVFGSINTNRTMQEMLSLANEMAQRIAYDTRDWRVLYNTGVFTGDGAQVSFQLPADYKRMLLTTNVRRSSSPLTPLRFIADLDVWLERRLSGTTDGTGEWTIAGGGMSSIPTMSIAPTLATGVGVSFGYLHRNPVRLASGGLGETFVNDGDAFIIDERLLKLGMVWQWKAQKGSPYAEDMGSYSDALANAMGHDQPAPIILGRRPISHADRVSGSWPIGWGQP